MPIFRPIAIHLLRLCVPACLVAFGAVACSRSPGTVKTPPFVRRAGKLDPGDWTAFKAAFLRPEGRVVDNDDDNGDKGTSGSEGQGCGMLLAEAYDDRAAFDRLWDWTRTHLQTRPDDRLLASRWRPDADDPARGQGHVDDPNNATDGDLLVAWALTRAGARWQDAALTDAARALCRDVRAKLVRPSPFGAVLLPGAAGFEKPPLAAPSSPGQRQRPATGTLVVNLSHWVFPAFPELYRLDPDALWPRLQQSGSALLRAARFGPDGLPADSVEIPAGEPGLVLEHPSVQPSGDPPVFGHDAVRVPLYLLWSGRDPSDELLAPFHRFWSRYPSPEAAPAVVGAASGLPVGKHRYRHDGLGGTTAGAALLGRWLLALPPGPTTNHDDPDGAPRAIPNPREGYRSSVLMLLVRVARAETDR